jgi:methylmalonyl-CoA/ethylmalonyl-CoA epimerase
VISRIHHVGIAVRNLEDAYRLYRDALGLPLITEAAVGDQGVRAALLAAGDTEIELLEPLGASSGMAKFIARNGEGLHHVCFETPDVAAELSALREKGAELVDQAPRDGLAGRIGFLHPRACAGVLVELAMVQVAGTRASPARSGGGEAAAKTTPSARSHHAGALRFARLLIGATTPRATADVFQRLFALPETAAGAGITLHVGHGALAIVPAADVDGVEGMAAIELASGDLDALRRALEAAGARPAARGTQAITLAPAATHGVALHITRHE